MRRGTLELEASCSRAPACFLGLYDAACRQPSRARRRWPNTAVLQPQQRLGHSSRCCRAINDPLQVQHVCWPIQKDSACMITHRMLAQLAYGVWHSLSMGAGHANAPHAEWALTFQHTNAPQQDALYETWAAEVDDWDTQEYTDDQLVNILYTVRAHSPSLLCACCYSRACMLSCSLLLSRLCMRRAQQHACNGAASILLLCTPRLLVI